MLNKETFWKCYKALQRLGQWCVLNSFHQV